MATRRPHVLLAEVPGWWHVRAAFEAELGRRGGVAAASPAEADALVVVGAPDDRLSELVERAWQQLPGPRARTQVTAAMNVPETLDDLLKQLGNRDTHTRDALQRQGFEPGEGDHMAPSGIPLASGADDRDGLEMDVLHLPLGPVLRHWPAGLVVRCTLSGDLVTEVDVEQLGSSRAAPDVPVPPRLHAARCLDEALAVLALAGSDRQRVMTRRLRDRLVLDDETVAAQDVQRLHAGLRRSWTLRWMLRGVGRHHGADVHDRLLTTVGNAATHLAWGAVTPHDVEADLLTDLLPGTELAQVRLVVASLGPRLETVAVRVSRG